MNNLGGDRTRPALGDLLTLSARTAAFKELMSGFPSGVAVVTTTRQDGVAHGLTCTSMCSLTADPPTLLVCVHNHSGTLAALRGRGMFAVNLLHADGQAVAERFASGRADRFAGVDWVPTGRSNLPYLVTSAHAVAECRLRRTIIEGDHTIVVGEVEAAAVRPGAPLLYGRRRFASWPVDGAIAHPLGPDSWAQHR